MHRICITNENKTLGVNQIPLRKKNVHVNQTNSKY